jgi:hypothetical protein
MVERKGWCVMGENLLLVGSVPLDTVEDVMRTFGGALGGQLPAMPDGEVGERRSWVTGSAIRFSTATSTSTPSGGQSRSMASSSCCRAHVTIRGSSR